VANEAKYVVLTAVGPDKPGLVNEVAALIHEVGANLEDSRMAILGGEFALLVLAAGKEAALGELERRVPALAEKLGLRVLLTPTARRAPGRYVLYRLRVSGVDHPGIVQTISKALAGRLVNVASLESRITYAPLSGTPMFVLEAELQVPSEVALAELRRDVALVCDQENLDFTLEASG
jgi:glycine cleavage system transcriptional repressor